MLTFAGKGSYAGIRVKVRTDYECTSHTTFANTKSTDISKPVDLSVMIPANMKIPTAPPMSNSFCR
jgi:hypothetical protein